METLPPEVVETFSKYLTPRDLARCCGVSPSWRGIFDQDLLWKSRCDPALEEPLRTTPSVVEPMFVSPEVENSTLPSISKWRLAYMRQEHLWSNWREVNYRENTTGTNTTGTYNEFGNTVTRIQFLSDTLIVKWYFNHCEIWNVSVIPATMIARTSVDVRIGTLQHGVLGNNMLFLDKLTSLQVFLVDVVDKSIKLKHEISLEDGRRFHGLSRPIFVDGSILLVRSTEETLVVFDLVKGEKVIEEPCPVVENKVGNVRIHSTKAVPTSDDVLVTLWDEGNCYHYIFSLKQRVFLPGPIAERPRIGSGEVTIHNHYVAIDTRSSLRIIDYHTSEVVFKNEGQEYHVQLRFYNDSFIFVDVRNDKCQCINFSLKTKTQTILFECQLSGFDKYELKIMNNRFVILFNSRYPMATFDLSSKIPEKTDISLNLSSNLCEQINSSFTRGSSYAVVDNGRAVIYYYW